MVISKKTKVAIAASLAFILLAIPSITVWYYARHSNQNLCQIHNFLIDSGDASTSLLLTPFIRKNRIEEGRQKSEVAPLLGVNKSFSGFITINETSNSNLFFWFFPVAEINVSF